MLDLVSCRNSRGRVESVVQSITTTERSSRDLYAYTSLDPVASSVAKKHMSMQRHRSGLMPLSSSLRIRSKCLFEGMTFPVECWELLPQNDIPRPNNGVQLLSCSLSCAVCMHDASFK
jgi:hypothetical protein